MQTIGERLEDARKRKGISLREAADATKIRSDFLSNIEQNKFDFDLPEIYKRGFVKNYARYLKLDVDKILTDFQAQLLTHSRMGKKSGSEWFGQMDLKKSGKAPVEEPAEEAPRESDSLGRLFSKTDPAARTGEREDSAGQEEDSDKTFYLKIGLYVVGTLVLIFIIFGLIWAIFGSGKGDAPPREVPVVAPQTSESNLGPGAGSQAQPPVRSNSVTLIASGNVYVQVRQKDDNRELYRNTMSAGEQITLEKSGPIDILFTAGENLTIEHGGERLRPDSSGIAKISIP